MAGRQGICKVQMENGEIIETGKERPVGTVAMCHQAQEPGSRKADLLASWVSPTPISAPYNYRHLFSRYLNPRESHRKPRATASDSTRLNINPAV
jgi:hypothetical protein